MAHSTPSQPLNQSSSPPSLHAPYHTAHRGTVTGPDGRFLHFLRQPDKSHLEGGYWRFQSNDDERRAHAHGFATPEDMLLAHEYGEEIDNSIIIRWVRGMLNPSFHMALSGTASQHLQCIYEVRRELGLPMSLRGQIPVYPKNTDPKLKQYWENMRSFNQQAQIDLALRSPGRPIPSPITPRSEQSCITQDNVLSQQVQRSLKDDITRDHAAKAVLAQPAVRAAPVQRSPNTPARPSQLSGASPLSWQIKPSVHLPQAAPKNAPWLSSRHPDVTPNAELNANRASSTGPAPSLPTSRSQPPGNPGEGVSQHNWVHQPSRTSIPYNNFNLVPLQQQAVRKAPTDPRLANPRPVTSAATSSNATHIASASNPQRGNPLSTTMDRAAAPLESPAEHKYILTPAQLKVLVTIGGVSDLAVTRPGNASPRSTSPLVPPVASPARRNDVSRLSTLLSCSSIVPGSRAKTPAPSPNAFSSSLAAPASFPGPCNGTRPVRTLSRPHTPRKATPTSVTCRLGDGAFHNGLSSSVAPPSSSPIRPTHNTPVASPTASKNSPGTPVKPDLNACANQVSARIIERTEHSAEAFIMGDADTTVASPILTQEERDAQVFNQAVDMFGCMDCGEPIGHKWSCNIDIKPLTNPTALDLRTLSDAVTQFDPTPAKTSHFNQFPTPPPEGAEAQIKGMADIIRDEHSYKENSELAGLPDDVMVFIWALRNQIVSQEE